MMSLVIKLTLTTFGLFLVLQAVNSDVVSLKMKPDSQNPGFTYINFYDKTFQQFYDCLTNNSSQTCTAVLDSDNGELHQKNDKYATSIETTRSSKSGAVNEYFTCKFDPKNVKTVCTRQPVSTSAWDSQTLFQAFKFRLKNSSLDSQKCVGILWSNLGEDVFFNDTQSYERCDPFCTSVTQNVHRSNKGKTDTIVAMVITLVIILGVVVVAGVLWRRHLVAKTTASTELLCKSVTSSETLSLGFDNPGAVLNNSAEINPSVDRLHLDFEKPDKNKTTATQVRTNSNNNASNINNNTESGRKVSTDVRNSSVSSQNSITFIRADKANSSNGNANAAHGNVTLADRFGGAQVDRQNKTCQDDNNEVFM